MIEQILGDNCLGHFFSPDLKIGETLAILKLVGNSFNSIDLLKITAKCSNISGAAIFWYIIYSAVGFSVSNLFDSLYKNV